MSSNLFFTKLFNSGVYIFLCLIFLFFNLTEIALADANQDDSPVNMKIPGQKNENMNDVFGPVASGSWYPDNKTKLQGMLTTFLNQAEIEKRKSNIRAIISPHAGLSIAGQCAAYAFKPLIGQEINRVMIIAPSHYANFRGLSIRNADYYKSPLGLIKVDREVCDLLLREKLISTIESAHAKEHSIENMLPFLQSTIEDFRLIPILVGSLTEDDYYTISDILKRYINEKTVIVVSSDFTHYGPNYGYMPFPLDKDTKNNLKTLDMGAIEKILKLDFQGYQQYLFKTKITICGRNAIGLLISILSNDTIGELVNYYTSGDLFRDFKNSVSYASIIFY